MTDATQPPNHDAINLMLAKKIKELPEDRQVVLLKQLLKGDIVGLLFKLIGEMSEEQQALLLEQLQERSETHVILEGNRILIPVTFNNDGVELEVTLLLDTGASQIVLNRQVADQLNIVALQKGLAQVAGGSSIQTMLGKVSYIKVGPYKMEDAGVLIIPHEGAPVSYSGLLGMNFLKNVEYSIDYKNQVIRWKLPQGQSAASN